NGNPLSGSGGIAQHNVKGSLTQLAEVPWDIYEAPATPRPAATIPASVVLVHQEPALAFAEFGHASPALTSLIVPQSQLVAWFGERFHASSSVGGQAPAVHSPAWAWWSGVHPVVRTSPGQPADPST